MTAQPPRDPSTPEAPQRDRWAEEAERWLDVNMPNSAPARRRHLQPVLAAALRAADAAGYKRGVEEEREACAKLAESALGDAAFLSAPCDHGTPCQYCLPDAIRARGQEGER